MNATFRYLGSFLLVAAVTVGAVAALNWYADPYGIWHFGGAADPVRARPRLADFERLHKAHEIVGAGADTLLMGNSRVVIGLDPHHPGLAGKGYNLGLSACTVYEMYRYLQHACAFHPPKLVVVGTDREMFDALTPHEGSFSEARLAVDAQNRPQPGWSRADLAPTIFSASAVVDSLRTLLYRGGPIRYPDGVRDLELEKPFLNARNVLEESERWKRRASLYAALGPDGTNPQFGYFREFLRFCRERGIRLIVYVNPVHSVLLDVLRVREHDYDDWLRQLVAAVEDEYPGAEVWDFATHNPITSEPLPDPKATASAMRYYWEISHYRQEVGSMVLDRIFGLPGARSDFGWKLTPENVPADLARLRREGLVAR